MVPLPPVSAGLVSSWGSGARVQGPGRDTVSSKQRSHSQNKTMVVGGGFVSFSKPWLMNCMDSPSRVWA